MNKRTYTSSKKQVVIFNKIICEYDCLYYSELFFEMLIDLANGVIKLIDVLNVTRHPQIRVINISLWRSILNSVNNRNENKYNIPNVIYLYVVKKAKIKYMKLL